VSLPTPLWPLRCLCRCELSTRPTKVRKAKGKGTNPSRKATGSLSDDDDIIDLEKRPTPRQGGDKDYAKTTDECLHVELTKQHFVACGAEKPRHKSALCTKKNPLSQ
jgi:hypothetical protein